MPTTLLIWLIFSFVSFLLLSNLKINPKSITFFRWIFTIISLPLLIISIYIFKISLIDNSKIIHLHKLAIIPINLSIYINEFNSWMLLISLLSLNIFILTTNYSHLSNLFSTLVISLFFIIFSQLPLNLLITICVLNIGNLLLLFSIFRSNSRNFSSSQAKNYYWLIMCDFFLTFAFLSLPANAIFNVLNKNIMGPLDIDANFGLVLLITSFLKFLILPSLRNDFTSNFLSPKINHLQYILYNSLMPVLILIQARYFILFFPSTILIIASSLLACYTLLTLFIDRKNYIEASSTIFLSSLAFLALSSDFYVVAESIACLLVFSIPFQIETLSKRVLSGKNLITEPKNKHSYQIVNIANNLIFKSLNFTANIISNFIGPIYGDILLLKIPQIIIGIIQMPLRLFHNGSIRRSVLFIIIMVISYYYIWEPQ